MNNIIKYFNDNFGELSQEKIEKLETKINNNDDDFYIELDSGEEFRLINKNSIERIFEDSITDLIDDCIILELPDNLKHYFNYDLFIRDASFDGYGNHFSGYDGSEELFDSYYIFRTN